MTEAWADLDGRELADETIVYVSLVNGVSPALAHLERDCHTHRKAPPRRVATIWREARTASARICAACARRFLITNIPSGRSDRTITTSEVAS